jgi:Domain of unknown function (DUF4157)
VTRDIRPGGPLGRDEQERPRIAPGKGPRTGLTVDAPRAAPPASGDPSEESRVRDHGPPIVAQAAAAPPPGDDPFGVHLLGAPEAVPHRPQMERLFNQDFSSVRSFTGVAGALGPAGVSAAAMGDTVAFSARDPQPAQHGKKHFTELMQMKMGELTLETSSPYAAWEGGSSKRFVDAFSYQLFIESNARPWDLAEATLAPTNKHARELSSRPPPATEMAEYLKAARQFIRDNAGVVRENHNGSRSVVFEGNGMRAIIAVSTDGNVSIATFGSD